MNLGVFKLRRNSKARHVILTVMMFYMIMNVHAKNEAITFLYRQKTTSKVFVKIR